MSDRRDPDYSMHQDTSRFNTGYIRMQGESPAKRRYVIRLQRPVYRQPIVWIAVAVLIALFLMLANMFGWFLPFSSSAHPGTPANSQGPSDPNAAAIIQPDNTTDAPSGVEPTTAPEPTTIPAPTPQPTRNLGPTVWYTDGGTYFHYRSDCTGMTGATQHSMLDGILAGKQPCDICVIDETTYNSLPEPVYRPAVELPVALGNVMAIEPLCMDISNVKYTVTRDEIGSNMLNVSFSAEGNLNMLLSKLIGGYNKNYYYDVMARAMVIGADGSVLWDHSAAPQGSALVGLSMPRNVSLLGTLNANSIDGAQLVIVVYLPSGFPNNEADLSVLGIHTETISGVGTTAASTATATPATQTAQVGALG